MKAEVDSSYRQSHAGADYGQRYKRTYERGYYHYQWIYLEQPLLEMIFGDLRSAGALRYLDFACGTGRILRVAEDYFSQTTGVDISETMLDVARQTCTRSRIMNIDITLHDLDARFDVITAFRFFLNAEVELRKAAMRAIYAHLTDGGFFVTNIHVNKRSILGFVYRARNWTVGKIIANVEGYGEFRGLLETQGFVIEDVFWYGFLPRTGWHLEWLSKHFMKPVEAMWTRLAFLPKSVAQSFLCVCRKT